MASGNCFAAKNLLPSAFSASAILIVISEARQDKLKQDLYKGERARQRAEAEEQDLLRRKVRKL